MKSKLEIAQKEKKEIKESNRFLKDECEELRKPDMKNRARITQYEL